jgi:hypothetical protein
MEVHVVAGVLGVAGSLSIMHLGIRFEGNTDEKIGGFRGHTTDSRVTDHITDSRVRVILD